MANGCHRMKNFMVNGGGVIKQKSPGTKCRAYFKKKAATYSGTFLKGESPTIFIVRLP